MGFFNDDICFCVNAKECPHKDTCRRADSKPGIHTYSNFYEEGKECDNYWKKTEIKKI